MITKSAEETGVPNAIVVQLVVRHLAKVEVASSSLVYRSKAEVQVILDFRYFFDFSVIISVFTRGRFFYQGKMLPVCLLLQKDLAREHLLFFPGPLFFFCRLRRCFPGLSGHFSDRLIKDASVPEKGSCGAFYGIRRAFAAPGHPRKYSGIW